MIFLQATTPIALKEGVPGISLEEARKIVGAVHRRDCLPRSVEMVRRDSLEAVRAACVLPRLAVNAVHRSRIDPFVRYALLAPDGQAVETVRIPLERAGRFSVRKVVERIGENCEPALTTVLFMAGAGGSLRAGVTENPIRLTRSIKEALVRVTSGGAPVYIWPGGGITYMVDVAAMPDKAFGYVPTPAIVGPIEFTMRLDDYRALGGHMESVRPLESIKSRGTLQLTGWRSDQPWPLEPG